MKIAAKAARTIISIPRKDFDKTLVADHIKVYKLRAVDLQRD